MYNNMSHMFVRQSVVCRPLKHKIVKCELIKFTLITFSFTFHAAIKSCTYVLWI